MAEPEPNQNVSEETVETSQHWNTTPPNRPRKVSAGMWGTLEIVAVAIGGLAMVFALAAFFIFVVPSNRELARNRSEADRLEAEVISEKNKYGHITNTETEVARIVSSVDDFEMLHLPAIATGQSALYQRLNSLIGAYGLTNTTGPDYTPLETADKDSGQQTEEEKGRSKFRSLYPGVYVSTTVEGSYQNLRRFIREVEAGREFIIVSAVELAPSDSEAPRSDAPQTAESTQNIPANPSFGGQPNRNFQPGFSQPVVQNQQERTRPKGKMHGDIVSLRIEMAAYFRRPNFAPAAPQ
jgi:hypothetical protein